MRRFYYILALASPLLFSGCVSVLTRVYSSNKSQVYIGTRTDVSGLFAHDTGPGSPHLERLLAIPDLPFSFAFDTICLPFDVYDWTQMPPAVDPLLGWTLVKPLLNPATGKPDDTRFPLNDKILGAATEFIKKKNFRYGPQAGVVFNNPYQISASQCYENGTGRHAVRLSIFLDKNGSYIGVYILVFDQSDALVKVIRYREKHFSMCRRSNDSQTTTPLT